MLAKELRKHIIDRTKQGNDANGASFAPYSKNYKDSELFQTMKSSTAVNLTLFGEMLNAIEFDINEDSVELFFDDEENAAKAHGHNNGSKILPKREFFKLEEEFVKSKINYYLDLQERAAPKMKDLINDLDKKLKIKIQKPEKTFEELNEFDANTVNRLQELYDIFMESRS